MSFKRIILSAVLVAAILSVIVLLLPRQRQRYGERYPMPLPPASQETNSEPEPQPVSTQTVQQSHWQLPKIKTKLSEFTTAEREAFEKNFQEKYRPAIQKWSKVYEGHVPFDPYDVTPDNFVERIGTQDRYREYIFVVNTITLEKGSVLSIINSCHSDFASRAGAPHNRLTPASLNAILFTAHEFFLN